MKSRSDALNIIDKKWSSIVKAYKCNIKNGSGDNLKEVATNPFPQIIVSIMNWATNMLVGMHTCIQ